MKGIGIDTGGTCTDAVIYDFETKEVLSEAKTLTTHKDLKIGIRDVLRKLPEDLLRECGQAALSTTLATNACVENLGGKGKIIFLGLSRKVFMEIWLPLTQRHSAGGLPYPAGSGCFRRA